MCALWDDLNDRHAPPEVVKAVVIELLARRKAIMDPIYQLRDWHWYDAEKHIYEEVTATGGEGRIVCASPPIQAVTVPDGWIKCSERTPEEGGRYWCYVEEQSSLGKSHYQWNCSWNGDEWSDASLSGRVTHWMPLAAAPALEVK